MAERIALAIMVGAGLLAGVIEAMVSGAGRLALSLLDIGMTAAFGVYLFSPVLATALLGVTVVLGHLVDGYPPTLFALAVAAGCVLRTGAVNLVMVYVGGLLIAAGVAAGDPLNTTIDVGGCLLVATVTGCIGLALRSAYVRSHRLARELADRARREHAAIIAERQRIAVELHDSIARDLTVIAMHVQLCGDDARGDSREVVRAAARRALDDVRAVIDLADEEPNTDDKRFGGLAGALDEARRTLEPMGYRVAVKRVSDQDFSSRVEIVLVGVLREAVTNVLKHAARGDVVITLGAESDAARLSVCNAVPTSRRRDLPSSGTGLLRAAERVREVGGRMSSGIERGRWCVAVLIPLN